jgi:hypothetical protein
MDFIPFDHVYVKALNNFTACTFQSKSISMLSA